MDRESIELDRLVVIADNLPSGILVQLQIKKDGEAGFVDYGAAVGAGGVVPVEGLEPCAGYWLRWIQVTS